MPPKILVIRLSSLGDIVLTAPVYRSLKARWPDCKISLLVKPGLAPALEGHSCIDEIIPFVSVGQALAKIRKEGFTHLLDLHANLRSTVLRTLAAVPKTSVYRKASLARRLYVALGLRSPSLEKHTVERYLEALAVWGVPPAPAALRPADVPGAGRPFGRPAHILVIQTSFLGDCLLTVPLLKGLKALFPQARLTVLAVERTAEVFRGCGAADEVIVDLKRGPDGGIGGTWRLARRLGAQGYDLAVIPHRSLRSAILAKLAGIARRVGFDSSAGGFADRHGALLLADARSRAQSFPLESLGRRPLPGGALRRAGGFPFRPGGPGGGASRSQAPLGNFPGGQDRRGPPRFRLAYQALAAGAFFRTLPTAQGLRRAGGPGGRQGRPGPVRADRG